MKKLGLSIWVAAFAFTFAVSAEAQTKRTTRRPAPPKVVTTENISPADMKTGAEKIAIQIKNITKFIYVLGGIASGIEALDEEAATKKIAKRAIEQNEQNKREVIQAIKNLEAGLAVLEVEFRTKEPLKKYLPHIQGITDLGLQSEDLAVGGKFVDAGKPLLLIVEKLSDTLVAMQ